MENYPLEELKRLEEKAHAGDAMRDFLNNGSYDLLNKKILEPMERAAFEVFKKIKADDHIGIVEAQMMSKVINQIRSTIESIIQEGQLAQETIRTSYALPLKEDE